jgi:putative DNA primase/helicase
MDKGHILSRLSFRSFYTSFIPSLKVNGNNRATGLCPFHDDHNPSLNINLDNGKWKCFVCDIGGDVFSFYMKHKGVGFKTALRELAKMTGVKEEKAKQKVVETFEYKDAEGNTLYKKERVEPGRNGKKKEFFFKHQKGDKWINGRGGEPVLYNLPAVKKSKYVIIVEGEAKADLLNKWGFVATCLDCGTGSNWRDEYTEILGSKEKVIILPDNDEAGRKYSLMIANELYGKVKELKVVELPGLPEKGDIIDWAKIEGNDKSKLVISVKSVANWVPEKPKNEDWCDPVLFGQIDTPEIPADILPSWLGAYAEAVSKHTQTPPAMAIMLGLSVVSTCLQKRFEVSPKEGWVEQLSLWTLSVMAPASRKTPVTMAMTKPLTTWEQEQSEEMESELIKDKTNRDVINKRIDRLQADASKTESNTEREKIINEIMRLREELPDEKKAPRLWTNDSTPERLQGLMAENNERLAVISDEGGIFKVIAGLYSNGIANYDIYLKSHVGSPVRVDRGNRTVVLQSPALAFGLAVQPAIISKFSKGSQQSFRGNGLLARFIFVIPKSNIGYRDVTEHNPIPASTLARYESGVFSLLSIQPKLDENGIEIPRILTLTKEAHDTWEQFHQGVENDLKDGGALELITDWGGKLAGTALRIAGLIHIVEHGADNLIIGKETIERTLRLCKPLIEHAQAAFDLMEEEKSISDAKHVFKWIIRKREMSFTRNNCREELPRFRKVKRLIEALENLTERQIISEPKERKPEGGGRASIFHNVNPRLFQGEC